MPHSNSTEKTPNSRMARKSCRESFGNSLTENFHNTCPSRPLVPIPKYYVEYDHPELIRAIHQLAHEQMVQAKLRMTVTENSTRPARVYEVGDFVKLMILVVLN